MRLAHLVVREQATLKLCLYKSISVQMWNARARFGPQVQAPAGHSQLCRKSFWLPGLYENFVATPLSPHRKTNQHCIPASNGLQTPWIRQDSKYVLYSQAEKIKTQSRNDPRTNLHLCQTFTPMFPLLHPSLVIWACCSLPGNLCPVS